MSLRKCAQFQLSGCAESVWRGQCLNRCLSGILLSILLTICCVVREKVNSGSTSVFSKFAKKPIYISSARKPD